LSQGVFVFTRELLGVFKDFEDETIDIFIHWQIIVKSHKKFSGRGAYAPCTPLMLKWIDG